MALDLSTVGFTSAPSHFTYDWKTVVLYALGIGAKRDELEYVFEGRGPRVYPTFAVCPVMPAVMECLSKTGAELANYAPANHFMIRHTRLEIDIPDMGKPHFDGVETLTVEAVARRYGLTAPDITRRVTGWLDAP